MTDTPNDPNATPNLGFSTRTDIAGTTGTQGDAAETGQPSADPQQVTPTDPAPAPAIGAQQGSGQDNAGVPIGADAPKLAELQNQLCPNCTTGILYVTRYDPYALYEQNQGAALAQDSGSGGAYDVHCAHCDFSESRAFRPGTRWGR